MSMHHPYVQGDASACAHLPGHNEGVAATAASRIVTANPIDYSSDAVAKPSAAGLQKYAPGICEGP